MCRVVVGAVSGTRINFISAVLDVTGVWMVVKAALGFDPITGDTYHGLDRYVQSLSGVITLLSYAAALPTGGASVVLANMAKMALINMLSVVSADLTMELATDLGLPPWACQVVAVVVGITITVAGGVYVMCFPSGKTVEIPIGEAPTTGTVDQVAAGFKPTAAEETLALAGAKRDAGGNPVDWRTGEPLVDSPEFRWDPDNQRWVAENPRIAESTPGGNTPEPQPGRVTPSRPQIGESDGGTGQWVTVTRSEQGRHTRNK